MSDVRKKWSGSTFIFGKNKVMQIALGKGAHDEIRQNMHQLTKHLVNGRGLLFTPSGPEEVINFFEKYAQPEYARAGFVATEDFTIPKGPWIQINFHSL